LFPFGAERVRQASGLAHSEAALRNPPDPTPNMADLVRAGRALAAPSLQRFAVTVAPRFDWDDLVLPADRKQQLQSVAARVTNRAIVQRDWGFGEKLSRGRGVAVLLSGPPGTGKTMAAEVLANALALDLFQIDLSTVVSKYIGETERQLSTIFAEAEQGQCILFFDECDAIFGKRTEVKDAHDRYANTEVNYLLQRLEQYEGTVLLATNFQKNIDEAFLRRLHDSIDFPFPDEAAREQIWRKQFPEHAPVDPNLDYGHLAAQFKLSGGHIRNAALYAAYRAAEEGGRKATIGMAHVLEGVRREFQKQGKLVLASDTSAAAAGLAR
jgi:SpoVK/Ycf46/Vps4 family AAA+-type ATPase